MGKKKAFVFDTNFIIQNKELDKVKESLDKDFNVYITQVSIDERIPHILSQLEDDYETIIKIYKKYPKGYFDIKTYPLEELKKEYRDVLQLNYEKHFGGNIIPLHKSKNMFERVLERTYTKIPPFINVDGASDKGFKDTLMWISIMDFFKDKGESEVIFVSDDGGFIKNTDKLIKEFNETTGKKIEIYNNEYYKNYLKKANVDTRKKEELPTVNQYRDKIERIVGDICCAEEYDIWGNENWIKTFTSNKPFDNSYVQTIFKNLKDIIAEHIFEKDISPQVFFNFDDRIITVSAFIPLNLLEDLYKLHEEISIKYAEYMESFYTAIANKLNENYVVSIDELLDTDDMPF